MHVVAVPAGRHAANCLGVALGEATSAGNYSRPTPVLLVKRFQGSMTLIASVV